MNQLSKILSAMAIISMALCACSKKTTPTPTPTPTPGGDSDMSIKVTLDTKLDIEKSQWAKGDAIKVYTSDANTELKAKEAGKSVMFEGKSINGDKFEAIYPANSGKNLPNSLKYVEGGLPSEYVYVGEGNVKDGIKMSALFAPVEITINGSCSLKSLELNGVRMELQGLVVAGTKVVYMLALASETTLTLKLTDTDNVVKEINAENVKLAAGQLSKMTIEHTGAINLSAAGTANCYVISGAGNYSFDAKKVDGSVINADAADWLWSSVECEWTEVVDGRTDVIKAVEPMNPAWVISDVQYKDGIVSFSASGNAGNAVIALYRNDGSNRLIVWSFHIWATDASLEQMAVANWQSKHLLDQDLAFTWMDRNLGALNSKNVDNAGIHGVQYQWGRKDPFPGTSKATFNINEETGKRDPQTITETEPFGDCTMPWIVNQAFNCNFVYLKEGSKTVAEMAAHPMDFTDVAGAWASDISFDSWGDGVAAYETSYNWCIDEGEGDTYAKSTRKAAGPKSNNDPCPVGYRVPTAEEIWNSFAAWTVGDKNLEMDAAWSDNIKATMSKGNYGRMLYSFADEDIKLRIPCSGMREGGKQTKPGLTCYYWTATIQKDYITANPPKNYAARWLVGANLRFIGSAEGSKAEAGAFGNARPVRCIAER